MTIRHIAPAKKPSIGKKDRDLSIIIPAAAPINGLHHTLLDINGRKLIEHQINVLAGCYPTAEIVYVGGYELDKVLKYIPDGVRVLDNELYANRTIVSSIRLGLLCATCPNVLIVSGDLFIHPSSIDKIADGPSSVLVTSPAVKHKDIGVVTNDDQVTHFTYGTKLRYYQVIFLTGKELGMFRGLALDKNNSRVFSHELLNKLLEKECSIKAKQIGENEVVEIDTARDLRKI